MGAEELSRRAFLAVGVSSLAAFPAAASAVPEAQWLGYETRLRDRLADGGGGAFAQDVAQEILILTNGARARAGARACAWSPELARVASAHAADLAERAYIGHLTPEGFGPSHRVAILARRMIGSASENIAFRETDRGSGAQDVLDIWRASPSHWSTLVDPSHACAGYGVVVRGDRLFAVGLYATPGGELAAPLPFRLSHEAELAAAVMRASPHFDGFSVVDPAGGAGWRLPVAPGQVLVPGVYQLRPRLRLDARRYEVLSGPIFVKV
ncbi:CAP domain-containing protein [Phenylobacterium koreense]|uniref:Uncharacterized protein YkwD n=3 Tax=Phenylobacterium TaxID=20 RepID=A0ABV2END6_9CAUL